MFKAVASPYVTDLLQNQLPYKETVKVSFTLQPFKDELPSIATIDGWVAASSLSQAPVSG